MWDINPYTSLQNSFARDHNHTCRVSICLFISETMWGVVVAALALSCACAHPQHGDISGKYGGGRLPPPGPVPPQRDPDSYFPPLGQQQDGSYSADYVPARPPPVPDTGYQTSGSLPGPPPQGGDYANGAAPQQLPPEDGGYSQGGGAPLGDCICVPYYQCKEGIVSQDGGGLLDARKKKPPKNEIPLEGLGDNQQCPGVDQICCREPSAVTEQPYEASCGIRNDNGINSRILTKDGKGEAEFGEWPWQAAVLKYESEILKFECGGTLVGSRHVLTVAHCVARFIGYDRVPLKVRLGEWDTQSMKEFYQHEDYDVGNIYVHPHFRNSSLWNDIALLELTRPVNFAPHISPICLPQAEDAFEGSSCVVTGWGKNAYRTGKYSNIMKEVTVPVIDNFNCQELLRQTRLGRYFNLHEGFICAGAEEGQDSCKGDGGGPLSCYSQNGRYVLTGLVAWGIDCGSPNVPGVYVRVAKYLNWIADTTRLPLSEFYPKQ